MFVMAMQLPLENNILPKCRASVGNIRPANQFSVALSCAKMLPIRQLFMKIFFVILNVESVFKIAASK
jgi:hypothetical protein